MILTLAQIPGWAISMLTVFFLLVCLSMILIVLIQRPQGGGLSGAFGAGGGSGQTAFGTKTGDVLTLVTIGIFILFLLTAIVLNFAVRPPEAGPSSNRVTSPDALQTEQATEKELAEMGTDSPETDSPEAELPEDASAGDQPAEPDTQSESPSTEDETP